MEIDSAAQEKVLKSARATVAIGATCPVLLSLFLAFAPEPPQLQNEGKNHFEMKIANHTLNVAADCSDLQIIHEEDSSVRVSPKKVCQVHLHP